MTTWTSPDTPEQKRYYSKRKGKLTAYEIGCLGVQIVWAYYDFPAYKAMFDAAFEYVPAIAFMASWLAAGLLILMHYLLKETYTTYWFDKLDDDEETDSSIWIPVLLMVALFVAGRFGIQMSAEKYIPPPTPMATDKVDGQRAERIAALDQDYRTNKAEIEAAFNAKATAATLKIDAEINALKSRRPKDESTRRTINGMITQLKTKRANTIAPIETAKADSMSSLLAYFDSRKKAEDAAHGRATMGIEAKNMKDASKYESTMGHVSWASWFISGLFVILYAALARAIVSIKVKSGILPRRDHTVLDQYGGVIGRMLYVLKDIFNRQFYRISVFIHRVGTWGSDTLPMLDSSYFEEEADYNSGGKATAPKKQITPLSEDQIRSKVFQKVMQEAAKGGVTVTPEMLYEELEKAQKMNGSYMTSDFSGKAEPSASAASPEGLPHPAAKTYDEELKHWAGRVQGQVDTYDKCMRANNPAQAQEAMAYINDMGGPIKKEAGRLGINYGTDREDDEVVVWKLENPAHKVPLSMLSESALNASNDQTEGPQTEIRFKSNLNQFSDVVEPYLDEAGNVIGVKYKKDDGTWSVIGKAATASRLRIQQRYARAENPSPKVLETLGKWEYAMQLIEQGKQAKTEILETVL